MCWEHAWALPPTSCVASGNSFHLENGEDSDHHFPEDPEHPKDPGKGLEAQSSVPSLGHRTRLRGVSLVRVHPQ